MAFEVYMSGRPVRGVLFDMDGVILDTEKLYSRFWREAAVALGYPMTHDQALRMRSLNRTAGQAMLEQFFGPGISHPRVRAKRIELMDAYVKECGVEPKPGAAQILAYLKERRIPAAISTSSPRQRVEDYLGPLGLLEGFTRICSAYDVPKGKPEPDIYLYGAASLALRPEDCLAVEDSPAGVRSAFRAGCMTVMVPDQDPPTDEVMPMLFAKADSLMDLIGLIEARRCDV